MSELEKYQPPQIAELDEWASKLYESGMFADVKSVAQAFVKIAAGAEIGLTPFQSITGVHFIQNKPVVGAGALASMLDHAPYNYTTEWEPDIKNPTACTITVFKHGVERGQARFSMDDAQRAGLIKAGGNWQKYPTDMLFARTVSQAARRYAPGATGSTFYVEAHGETEIVPDAQVDASPKPRTRVTAEVQNPRPGPPTATGEKTWIMTGTVADSEERIEDAEVIEDSPLVVAPGKLLEALTALDTNQRKALYAECGIEKGMKLPEVTDRLWIKWAELGLPDDVIGEPVPVTILGAIYQARRDSVPADGVETFDHWAKTGQDLEADPQTVIT